MAGSIKLEADTAEFKRLFDRSSVVDAKLRTTLRRNIRLAGERAADAVRIEVADSAGETASATPHHTGLRLGIASGVKVQVMTGARAGVTIVASSTQMPAGKESLVRAWESAKGWRHPVRGNREVWAQQVGHPYFRTRIGREQPMIRVAVESAMKEAAASLKG
jgi:hypothetical protein